MDSALGRLGSNEGSSQILGELILSSNEIGNGGHVAFSVGLCGGVRGCWKITGLTSSDIGWGSLERQEMVGARRVVAVLRDVPVGVGGGDVDIVVNERVVVMNLRLTWQCRIHDDDAAVRGTRDTEGPAQKRILT